MTNRQFNALKKKLLQGDRQAFHDILLNEEAAKRAENDPEIMAYLETREMSDYLTESEVKSIENIVNISKDYIKSIANIGSTLQHLTKTAFLYAPLIDFEELKKTIASASEVYSEARQYMDEVLKRPEYAHLTPHQFFVEKHTDENGNNYTLYQKFKQELEEGKEAEELLAQSTQSLPVLYTKKAGDLHKPTDKINTDLIQPLYRDKWFSKGQQGFLMARAKNGSPVPVTLSMQMDENKLAVLGVKEHITPMDITIMQAISTIFVNENLQRSRADKGKPVYCTPNRLWLQMGARSKLNGTNPERLEKALQKLGTTWVELDSSALLNEYTQYGTTGKKVRLKNSYKGNLIHVDLRQRGIVDGKETDSIITIYADPVLMEFARDIDQITAVPLYVQQATGTLNDDNLAIANYLQSQIAWLKNDPKRNKTINYENLKKKTCTIKRDKQLRQYIEQLLTEYANPPKGKDGKPIQAAWIEGFTKVPTGYRIKLPSPDQPQDQKKTKQISQRKKKPAK